MKRIFLHKTIGLLIASVFVMSQPVYADITQAIKTKDGQTFYVMNDIGKKYPELVDLIIMSESMNHQGKQEWLDRLPVMNNQQIDKLFNILFKERIELERLNAQFERDVAALNKKHEAKARQMGIVSSQNSAKQNPVLYPKSCWGLQRNQTVDFFSSEQAKQKGTHLKGKVLAIGKNERGQNQVTIHAENMQYQLPCDYVIQHHGK